MLRDGWNFHGDIAISLESDACSVHGINGRPFDKIFDADAIELGSFAEVMIILVRDKTNFTNTDDKINEFIEDCVPYMGKSAAEIPADKADDLYNQFRQIIGK